MQLADKCQEAAEHLSVLYGEFVLFSLVRWERSAGKWDVVVSAPWLTLNGAGLQQIVDGLKPFLSPGDWLQIGSVIPFSPERPLVQTLVRLSAPPPGEWRQQPPMAAIQTKNSFMAEDFQIDEALLIRANSLPEPEGSKRTWEHSLVA